MPTLADLRTAGAIQQQVSARNDASARSVIESLSPYIDFLKTEDPDYMNMGKEKFDNLLDSDKEKLITLLNSSPVATSYRDINTQETKKGKIVDIVDDNGKISFAIQGEQGIVPKTLGFSNDPQDVVMFTDREGLRTMANTILQGQSNRLTSQRKGYGSRAMANATLQGVRLSEALDQAESIPEATTLIEQAVETGELQPAQAFEMLIEMGTDYNDGLDAYRKDLVQQRADNKKDRDRIIKEESKGDISDVSKFGSPLPGTGIKFDNSPQEPEVSEELKAARAKRDEIAGRLRDSEMFFPVSGTAEQMLRFVQDNEQMMIEVGGDQNILNKARAAFNKYKVSNPEDLSKIPEYDTSIDISKAEIAAALAVASGGNNFTNEFNNSLRLLTTGDAALSSKDVQEFNRKSKDMNMRLGQYIRESEMRIGKMRNDAAKDIASRLNDSLKSFTQNMTDEEGMFAPGNFKGKASVDVRNIINAYGEAVTQGLLTPEIDGYFRNATGTLLQNMFMEKGQQEGILTSLPVIGALFDKDVPDMPLGDPAASMRAIFKEDKNGKPYLDRIILVDSQERQVGPVLTGKDYADLFNDTFTESMISRYIPKVNPE